LQRKSQLISSQDSKELKNNSNRFRTFFKIITGLLAFVIFILIILYNIGNDNEDINNHSVLSPSLQNEIAKSVVNIFCPSTKSDDEHGGGSGTIVNEEGLILTNSHIIPQDEEHLHVDEFGCMVVLPDPKTGLPDEVYLAHPITIPELSHKYDLAYLQIYSAFYDEEEETELGVYPRVFPVFDDTERCRDESIQLGEFVRIFGYPDISGGHSLTITDGIVSNFTSDWLIMTSAKVSHGNSGGLAVDKYGCMLGVPSRVSSDEMESLGIIIPIHLIREFNNKVDKYLNSL
jgi:S1-C subfamily serine protease